MPEYYFWDLETPRSVDCPFGGTLHFEPTEEGESFTLADCAFSPGSILAGNGVYQYEEDVFSLTVSISGTLPGDLVLRSGTCGGHEQCRRIWVAASSARFRETRGW